MKQLILGVLYFLMLLSLISCGSVDESLGKTEMILPTKMVAPIPEATSPYSKTIDAMSIGISSQIFGYTHHRSDGNRYVNGSGDIPNVVPLEVSLSGTPEWLVAVPFAEGSQWTVVLEGGRVEAFTILDGEIEQVEIAPSMLPPGMPPVLASWDGVFRLFFNQDLNISLLTNQVPLSSSLEDRAYIAVDGSIVTRSGTEKSQLDLDVLKDGRILQDETGKLLFLTNHTDRYDHGVLGDDIEAGGFALMAPNPQLELITHVELSGSEVFEGIAPIWADLDGDAIREIILTKSDILEGARIIVYKEDGRILAEGPSIGTGYRWRHQLVVAPFGINGELELAVIRTPHIGGVVEFYRLIDGELIIGAKLSGYSSHRIGSRNLDTGLAGDFDGDGRVELIVPDQAHQTLYAIRRNETGAEAVWSLPLNAPYATNLAAVTLPNGEIGLGVGTEENYLHIWVP